MTKTVKTLRMSRTLDQETDEDKRQRPRRCRVLTTVGPEESRVLLEGSRSQGSCCLSHTLVH